MDHGNTIPGFNNRSLLAINKGRRKIRGDYVIIFKGKDLALYKRHRIIGYSIVRKRK